MFFNFEIKKYTEKKQKRKKSTLGYFHIKFVDCFIKL